MSAHLRHGRTIEAVARLAGGRLLGPLETRVLELLWRQDLAVTVREVGRAFPELAYTTLMTTLDRLYRKGMLLRSRCGRAFAYRARYSQDALLGERAAHQIADLLTARGARTAILSSLVNAVGRRDAALLDELQSLVQAERSRLEKEGR